MADCFIVLNVERSGNRRDQGAVLEIHQKAGIETNYKQGGRSWVSITILPVRIEAADDPGQAIGRAVQVDRSDLAGTGCQDGRVGFF